MPHNLRREPLPDYLKPKLQRLGKRRYLTIAIGILCSDGVILCADTQESVDQYSKVSRPKVFELTALDDRIKAVLAGSGDAVFIDALRIKLESALDLAELTCDSLCEKLEQALLSYYSTIWPLYPSQKDRPTAELLIGMRAPDGFVLLHASGPIVRRVTSYESVGFGTVFSTYHLDKLFKSSMKVEHACPVAAYVLDLVKENVEFCGGETHMFVIVKEGEAQSRDADYIREKTAAFKEFARIADGLLARAASFRLREEGFFSAILGVYENAPDDPLKPGDEESIQRAITAGTDAIKIMGEQIGRTFTEMAVKMGVGPALIRTLSGWRQVLVQDIKERGEKVDAWTNTLEHLDEPDGNPPT